MVAVNQYTYVVPRLRNWDFYDLNWGDDIQEATTDFTTGTPQNWILPFPADAEDPDEAMLVHQIHHRFEDKAYDSSGAESFGSIKTTAEKVANMRFWVGVFEFDETDESTEAYRDECKQAIAYWLLKHQNPATDVIGTDAGAGFGSLFQEEGVVLFESPFVFPLNPAVKTAYFLSDTGSPFLSPEHHSTRIYYRVIRNPLNFLGRILALMRQNLSG